MTYTLLTNVLYVKNNEVYSGFIYFNNEKIIDIGLEPSPEYELSELIMSYENRALAIHGFSVAIDIFKYVFREKYSKDTISTLSNNELEKIVNNVFYELYLNGITLPVVYGDRVDIINKFVKENNLEAVIVHSGELREYSDLNYITVRNNKLFHKDRELGTIEEILCNIRILSSKCLFIDTTNYFSQNIPCILNDLLTRSHYSFDEVIKLLHKPYTVLRLDNGELDIGSKPDILIHDLRNSLKTIPWSMIKYVLLKNHQPDQVFVKGEFFFDRGEPLALFQQRVDDIMLKY